MILLLGVLLGWAAGRILGGATARLADPGFRWLWLPIASAVIQMCTTPLSRLIPLPAESWYGFVVILTYGANAAFALANLRPLAGSLPILMGTLGNFAVIAANGWRMPVAPSALQLPQLVAPAERLGYYMADSSTRLLWLGDVLPLPLPLVGGYMSLGDILLFLGVAVLIAGRIKTMNESIYYNVDGLHTAIAKERQIQFRYFRWGPDKTMILRHNGELYTVSPWHLCWDDENYYLVAYDSASGRIKHYRVDKMKNITITDLPRDGAETMEHLDLTIYTRRLFGMFGGEPIRVTLEGDDDMINVLIDRFGDEIPLSRKDGDRVETRVDVAVSPQFLGWVASFGGKLTVTSPPSVKEQMRTLARKLSEQYEGSVRFIGQGSCYNESTS